MTLASSTPADTQATAAVRSRPAIASFRHVDGKAIALPWMLVAVAVSLTATRLGVGVTPDSGHYVATADNLLAGRGFVRLGPEIMTAWPPVYPAILAAGQLVGLDSLTWARAINALLFPLCVLMCVLWTLTRTGSRAAAAAAGAAMSLGPPLVYVSSLALTEMPFITLQVLALWKLDTWLERPSRRTLIVCTAAVAAACLTRYQGLALAATLGLVILGLGTGPIGARLRVAVTVTALALLPLALWITRNVLLTGHPAGLRLPSEYGLAEAAVDLGRNAMSWYLPWRVLLWSPYAGLALMLALGAAAILLVRRGSAGTYRTVAICVTFVVMFVILSLAAVTRTSMDPLATRILSPLYPCLTLIGIIAATFAVRSLRPTLGAWRLAVGGAAAAMLMATLMSRTAPAVAESWREGPGGVAHSNFNTEAWRTSPTLLWARDNLRGPLVFSSSQAAMYLTAGIDSRPMPRKHARRAPNVPHDRLEDIRDAVAQAGHAYLVVNHEHVPTHTFKLDELSSVLRVTKQHEFSDGAVFRLEAR